MEFRERSATLLTRFCCQLEALQPVWKPNGERRQGNQLGCRASGDNRTFRHTTAPDLDRIASRSGDASPTLALAPLQKQPEAMQVGGQHRQGDRTREAVGAVYLDRCGPARTRTSVKAAIANSTNAAGFEAYLAQFPNGVFRALAQNRMATLRSAAENPAGAGGMRVGAASVAALGRAGAGRAGTVSGGTASGFADADGDAAAVDARPQPGEVFRDCEDCPEMVVVPAGRFRMGCVSGQDCFNQEFPVHEVQVGSFALSKYEVLLEEYDRFVRATGRARPHDEGWGRVRRPVDQRVVGDATAYAEWLSAETGEQYRLPSEAEWEYPARAGTTTAYSWGTEIGRNQAVCYDCGSRWDREQTAPAGSFPANAWKLHGMHGNVGEWVKDCWHDSSPRAPTDGSAWTRGGDCGRRVFRGGSWSGSPWYSRSAYRASRTVGRPHAALGFRLSRTLTP